VLADSGAIGGKDSQEFMLITDIGEDVLLVCAGCGYAANSERAEAKQPDPPEEDELPLENVHTPGQKTIEDLARFLGLPVERTLKAVFYMAGGVATFVAIRGDLEVNEVKLANALGAFDLRLMTEDEVAAGRLFAGSASPVGLKGVCIVADPSAVASRNLVAGANRPDYHLLNVNYGRDWQADVIADIALARAGDACANCGAPLQLQRGIEMGHIFKLGAVYSEKMGATFLDAEGHEQPAIMGCYGIGTSRLLQCVIEANHDERGIVWPAAVAPFDVHLVGLGLDRAEVVAKAEALYESLQSIGVEVLFDDRNDASAGVKFNDADLLGLPMRVTISPRSIEQDAVEVKRRNSVNVELVPYVEAVNRLVASV
jgi:prolyl-tRNA synthetase